MGAVLVSPLCFMLPGTSHWRVAKLRGEKLGAADAVICGVQVVAFPSASRAPTPSAFVFAS